MRCPIDVAKCTVPLQFADARKEFTIFSNNLPHKTSSSFGKLNNWKENNVAFSLICYFTERMNLSLCVWVFLLILEQPLPVSGPELYILFVNGICFWGYATIIYSNSPDLWILKSEDQDNIYRRESFLQIWGTPRTSGYTPLAAGSKTASEIPLCTVACIPAHTRT